MRDRLFVAILRMSASALFQCPLCQVVMNSDTNAPIVINCGHTICKVCSAAPGVTACPLCGSQISTRIPNLHLQKVISVYCDTPKPKEDREKSPRQRPRCTYEQYGKKYIDQPWYFCKTCGLVGGNGCCQVCAEICHAGHDVVYAGRVASYCDCGPSGKCQALGQLEAPDPTICTFAKTGLEYWKQPWYHCATCNLVGSLGCCEACARICHAGHATQYAGTSMAFCDCGNGSGKVDCKCLRPQEEGSVTYCTFFERQGNPFEQVMYQCLDCGIVDSRYLCQACMVVCHSGHQIRRVDGLPNAVCACGAGEGVNPCAFGPPVCAEEQLVNPCTFAITGKEPIRQMWFECRTCGLTQENGSGMCEICARLCHRGHDVFCCGVADRCYCDCGGGHGKVPCRCMKWQPPQKCVNKLTGGARRQMLYSCATCGDNNLYCVYCAMHCHRDHAVTCAGYQVGVCQCHC